MATLREKIWNDPVWSGVIVAGICTLAGAVYAYLKVGLPGILDWALNSTAIPNWLLVFIGFVFAIILLAFVVRFLTKRRNFDASINGLVMEASDPSASVVALLRKAKSIALKLGDHDFSSWASKELEGSFENLTPEVLPDYRRTYGDPEAMDQFGRWMPVRFSNEEAERLFTYAPFGQDLVSIEGLVKSEGLQVTLTNQAQRNAAIEHLAGHGAVDYRLIVSSSHVSRILDAVRHRVHEWALSKQN